MSDFTVKTFKTLCNDRFINLSYRDWGAPENPKTAVCVHGLSRNCRDFDDLAAALSSDWRVVALDMPGRGESDWLDDKSAYGYPLYEQICAAFIAHLGVDEVTWIGTSMGGNLGMRLASKAVTPISKLVLNDIGPFTPAEGRRHNQANFGKDPRFESEAAGIKHVRETRTVFGPFDEAGWEKFGRDSLRQLADGQWTLHYDPGLSRPAGAIVDTDNWQVWPKIKCPVLTVWGQESKLLLDSTVERMSTTGPKSAVFPVPGIGHCPGLTAADQIDAISSFLAD